MGSSAAALVDDVGDATTASWLTGIAGVLMVGLGVFLLVDLVAGVWTLVLLVSLALLAEGVFELVRARQASAPWTGYLLGLVALVAGIVAVAWPEATLLALAIVAGTALVVSGCVRFGTAVLVVRPERGWVLSSVLGVVDVVIGIVAFAWPEATVLVLAILLGFRLVVRGLVAIAVAWQLHKQGSASALAVA